MWQSDRNIAAVLTQGLIYEILSNLAIRYRTWHKERLIRHWCISPEISRHLGCRDAVFVTIFVIVIPQEIEHGTL